MNILPVSQHKLKNLFKYWRVRDDYAEPLYNYLVYGFNPGSFWTSVLANNFVDAMLHSHPNNNVNALKDVSRFIVDTMPVECWGSYENVNNWIKLSEDQRRTILEQCDLIYTPEVETWETIKGDQWYSE